MKGKSRKVCRLSPNEEAQLIREELQRRRKLRLQQVREQERIIALQVRREVKERRERELQSLGVALRGEWQKQRGDRIQTLEKLFMENLRVVGQGHRDAEKNEPDREALALKKEQNETRAAERHQKALRSLITRRQAETEQRNRQVEGRKKALIVERERAANIASLPHSSPDPIECVIVKTPLQPKTSNMQHYSITHYHIPETVVDIEADTVQPNAQKAAELEARRLEGLEKEESRERQEQLERARLRGDQALRKEKGIQDNSRLLCELGRLQQAELQRRKYMIKSIPARIFQPLYRQNDLRAEQQRELENAFQDMCTKDKEIRNDLVLSEPLPAPPIPSDKTDSTTESELDVTLEPNETPYGEDDKDAGQESATSQSSSVPPEDAGKMALRRLLNRIRTQKDQQHGREPLQGQGEAIVENADNKQGLPCNLEWQQASSLEEGTVNTLLAENNSKMSEDSIVAEPMYQPDQQSAKIDLRLREELLNRQQVEQFALLQELEEKRQSLELKLNEAKLHRDRLQDALEVPSGICSSQESPTSPPEEIVSEPLPEETVSTFLSDNIHKQRLHQYQQRLLRQNRLHQKTIDEACRNLEEYKQMLMKRYGPVGITVAETQSSSETVYALPSLPHGTTAITGLLNSDTESCLPETVAVNIKPSHHNNTLLGSAFLIQPPLPSHSPALSTHPTPISVPVGISQSVEDTIAMISQPALSFHDMISSNSEQQDVPLLPPAVFMQYLRNKRSQAQFEHQTPLSQQGPKKLIVVENVSLQLHDAITKKNQKVLEQICHQKDALCVLLGAQHAKEQSPSLDGRTVMDVPVKERSNELVISNQSGGNKQQTSDLGSSGSVSAEHSLWESASDGGTPVSCPPRTLQILLHDFERHKLSTIEEVDTPVNVSMDTAAELQLEISSAESSDYSCSLFFTPPTQGSENSQGASLVSAVSTSRPSKMSWREMLQMESTASHADSSAKQHQEDELKWALPPDGDPGVPDFFFSTTLSTGTYFSSEHEPDSNVSDNSFFSNEFPACLGTSLTSSSISNSLQHIIDKYTKELDMSLRTVHTGGSVSVVPASESRISSMSISSDARMLKAAQNPTLPLQYNMEDSHSLNITMQDTFQSLFPEVTNNDMTELSAAFQLSLNASVGNTNTNMAASDWLDCDLLHNISATDGQSSFASADLPKWEWTLGNNSDIKTPKESVPYEAEDFSLQNIGKGVMNISSRNKQD